PSPLYQRLLGQVYGRSAAELGFPATGGEAGTGGGGVDPDAVAALLYVAPPDTARLARVAGAQARVYTPCLLPDPHCPPACLPPAPPAPPGRGRASGGARPGVTLQGGLAGDGRRICLGPARAVGAAPGRGGGVGPDWVRPGRLHACAGAAGLFPPRPA